MPRRDEVLQRRRERVRRAALQVGAAERRALSAAAGEGVEVELRLAERAGRDGCPSPSDSAGRDRRGVDRAGRVAAAVQVGLRSPQHGGEFAASHCDEAGRWSPIGTANRTGFVPPCERSYWISRSPAVRTGVTPLPEIVSDWLNSKSMFVVPCGSCTRCQNRFRKPAAGAGLEVDAEVQQVALVRRDAAVDDRRDWRVLLRALTERVVSRSGGQVRSAALGDVCPVDRRRTVSSTLRLASSSISKLLPASVASPWLAAAGAINARLPASIPIAPAARTRRAGRDGEWLLSSSIPLVGRRTRRLPPMDSRTVERRCDGASCRAY